MAITSISRIQVRRGIATDLPDQLFEGEFGWVLDARELFIGNGEGFSGNTEILTQYSDNTQLINYSYRGPQPIAPTTGQNGIPTVRPIGAKLDDWISVKDYGAQGDGITDDTDAIQNAIKDRWATNGFGAIYFPAGVYLISNTIDVYSNTILLGEDDANTIIKMNTSNSLVALRTADNLGQTGYNIGLNGAPLPSKILIQGFTIDSSATSNSDGLWIQRSSYVRIVRCKIIGRWQTGISSQLGINGIKLETLGTIQSTNNIQIIDTKVSNYVNAIYMDDPVKYIILDRLTVRDSWRGVSSGLNAVANGPSFVKISDSLFNNIDNIGVLSNGSNPGITSVNNIYDTVGDTDGTAVISFGSNATACSSIGDSFSRLDSSRIYIANPIANSIFSPQQTSLTSNTPVTAKITLLDNSTNQPTGITYNPYVYNTVFIKYSIGRGISKRAGELVLIGDNTASALTDNGTNYNGSPGITFSTELIDGMTSVNYTSTNTGNNASMEYIETKWLT